MSVRAINHCQKEVEFFGMVTHRVKDLRPRTRQLSLKEKHSSHCLIVTGKQGGLMEWIILKRLIDLPWLARKLWYVRYMDDYPVQKNHQLMDGHRFCGIC